MRMYNRQGAQITKRSRKRSNQEFVVEPEPNRTSDFFCRTEPNFCAFDLRSYQLKLIKMLAELANLNHYAAPFLSRAAVNLSLYNSSPVMKLIEFWRSVMSLKKKMIHRYCIVNF